MYVHAFINEWICRQSSMAVTLRPEVALYEDTREIHILYVQTANRPLLWVKHSFTVPLRVMKTSLW